jgi:hypothetical protein
VECSCSVVVVSQPEMIHKKPLLEVSYLWNFRHRLVRYCWYIKLGPPMSHRLCQWTVNTKNCRHMLWNLMIKFIQSLIEVNEFKFNESRSVCPEVLNFDGRPSVPSLSGVTGNAPCSCLGSSHERLQSSKGYHNVVSTHRKRYNVYCALAIASPFPQLTNWISSAILGLVLDIWLWLYSKVPHGRVITSRRMGLLFLPKTSVKPCCRPFQWACNPPKRIKTCTHRENFWGQQTEFLPWCFTDSRKGRSTSSAKEVHGPLGNSKILKYQNHIDWYHSETCPVSQ